MPVTADPSSQQPGAISTVTCVHATAIGVGNRAVLIRGPSGSGKSDLALRCLAIAAGPFPADFLPVRLIADDQVQLTRHGDTLEARAPNALAGKLEVRGLGIVHITALPMAAVVLVADIVPPGPSETSSIERYPDPWPLTVIAGLSLPVIQIAAFEPSAPLKILLALAHPDRPAVRDCG